MNAELKVSKNPYKDSAMTGIASSPSKVIDEDMTMTHSMYQALRQAIIDTKQIRTSIGILYANIREHISLEEILKMYDDEYYSEENLLWKLNFINSKLHLLSTDLNNINTHIKGFQ